MPQQANLKPLMQIMNVTMATTSMLLLVLVTAAYAIVCLPGSCKNVKCAEVTEETCDGRISINGSLCGCCDMCVAQLGKNKFLIEKCKSPRSWWSHRELLANISFALH